MKKKFLTLFAAITMAATTFANGIEIDGIHYILAGDTAVVTYMGEYSFNEPFYTGNITIPTSVTYQSKDYFVTCIGEDAFGACSSLVSITIPNSVKSFGNWAFARCTALALLTIPNSVTSIGDGAFSGCTSLTSVTIPNSVTSIGDGVFIECPSLTSILVDAANTHYSSIDGVLFNYAKDTLIRYPIGNARISYTIPSSVLNIGDCAFAGCDSLVSINIPSSVTSIGTCAFTSCSFLSSINIPSTITSIGMLAFSDCNSMPVENGLRYADTYLIEPDYKSSPTYIIKEGTKWIGDQAFYFCSELTSIVIPNSVIYIGDRAFNDCSSLSSVTIGNSVLTIEEGAFNGCTSLTAIIIPHSVKYIGDYAFNWCTDLRSVNIGNSVMTIKPSAFAYCSSLKSITCEAAIPPSCETSSFYEVDKNIPLYVPLGSVTAYNDSIVWKDFTNIKAITAQEVEVTEVESEPESTSVVIAWPAVSGSDNYTIEVKQGSKVICTIIFNAQGQLLSINFSTAAPARGKADAQYAEATATGWAYQINGLTPGTNYTYSVVAKDAGGNVLDTKNGSFTTNSPTAIENINNNDNHNGNKILRNGILLIEQNGVYYNAQGAIVE